MAESDEEKNDREKEAESDGAFDTSEDSSDLSSNVSSNQSSDLPSNVHSDVHSDALADVPASPPLNPQADLPPDTALESDKRVSDAEPQELVQALRQVFNGSDEKPGGQTGPIAAARPIHAIYTDSKDYKDFAPAKTEQSKSARGPEAKSGYSNPFALFADVFYGVLIAPRATLSILSNSSKFPPTFNNLFLTCLLVLFVLALPASIKLGAAGGSAGAVLSASLFILANLANWTILAFILYYLSIFLRGSKLTLGNAFIATGWAYLPFAFFAPVACFKGALGHGFMILACLPALWFLALQWLAFQTSLRTSTIKLALIALVVPPIFCLVYLFWIGLAVFSLLTQLLAHLT